MVNEPDSTNDNLAQIRNRIEEIDSASILMLLANWSYSSHQCRKVGQSCLRSRVTGQPIQDSFYVNRCRN